MAISGFFNLGKRENRKKITDFHKKLKKSAIFWQHLGIAGGWKWRLRPRKCPISRRNPGPRPKSMPGARSPNFINPQTPPTFSVSPGEPPREDPVGRVAAPENPFQCLPVSTGVAPLCLRRRDAFVSPPAWRHGPTLINGDPAVFAFRSFGARKRSVR